MHALFIYLFRYVCMNASPKHITFYYSLLLNCPLLFLHLRAAWSQGPQEVYLCILLNGNHTERNRDTEKDRERKKRGKGERECGKGKEERGKKRMNLEDVMDICCLPTECPYSLPLSLASIFLSGKPPLSTPAQPTYLMWGGPQSLSLQAWAHKSGWPISMSHSLTIMMSKSY